MSLQLKQLLSLIPSSYFGSLLEMLHPTIDAPFVGVDAFTTELA